MKQILNTGVAWRLSRVMHSCRLSIRGAESSISPSKFLVNYSGPSVNDVQRTTVEISYSQTLFYVLYRIP